MNALRFRLALVLLCCTATPAVFSQVVSINTVGYLFRTVSPGDNLIANQFDNETGNTLNSLFNGPGLQTGATFTKWDSTANQFVPASFYDSASGTWSINYTLTFGEGGLLHSPSVFTNLFLGSVYLGYNLLNGELTWNPGYSAGLHLLSSPIPATGFSGLSSFEQAVGRAPVDGEWVKTLDEATQT